MMRRREMLQLAAALAVLPGKSMTSSGDPAQVTATAGVSQTAYLRARNRAAALVATMTLAEKISQTGNTAPAIKRLGLSRYQYWSEALHGLARGYAKGTSFPQPLALAAAWNPELNLRVYTAVSDEARAWHNRTGNSLTFYSPQTLNLHRDPRWGRCEEAASEDPCLAGTLAVQVGCGSCAVVRPRAEIKYQTSYPGTRRFCTRGIAARAGASREFFFTLQYASSVVLGCR